MRIFVREELDGCAVVRAEPRGRVADPATQNDQVDEREHRDSRATRRGRAVVAPFDETRPDDHVAIAFLEAGQQRRDVIRRVLSVAVELHGDVMAVALRKQEAALHGSADAEVEGKIEQPRSGVPGDRSRIVRRAVVDDQDIRRRIAVPKAADHRGEVRFLVVRGNDEEDAAHESSIASRERLLG